MANKERGEVELQAGGKTYTLRFGFNEMAAVETVLGVNFFEHLMPKFQNPVKICAAEWRALFYAALQGGGHTDVTLMAAGGLLTQLGLERVGAAIANAVTAAFPEADGAAKENPPVASDSAGTTKS